MYTYIVRRPSQTRAENKLEEGEKEEKGRNLWDTECVHLHT